MEGEARWWVGEFIVRTIVNRRRGTRLHSPNVPGDERLTTTLLVSLFRPLSLSIRISYRLDCCSLCYYDGKRITSFTTRLRYHDKRDGLSSGVENDAHFLSPFDNDGYQLKNRLPLQLLFSRERKTKPGRFR